MRHTLQLLAAFSLLLTPALAQHPQDECSGAVQVFAGNNVAFDTTGATNSTPGHTCGLGGSDIWFRHIATDNTLDVSLCGSTYDTVLEIYSGACGSLTSLACLDDSCGLQTALVIPVAQGSTYYIRVGGFNGTQGAGTLFITAPPPDNDDCTFPEFLPTGVPVTFNTALATTSSPWPCALGGNDLWFVAFASSATLDISLCGSSYDTCIEVFDGACFNLTSLGCNDDSCGLQSTISVPATPGVGYLVRVGGFNGERGTGVIEVVVPSPPIMNDECSGAAEVFEGVPVAFDTTDNTASATPTSTCYGLPAGVDEWYFFTAPTGSQYTASLCGSSYDTTIQVFDTFPNAACGSQFPLACNDDACGVSSSVDFIGSTGQTFYIRVGGFANATGVGTLTVTQVPYLGDFVCFGTPNSTGGRAYLLATGSTSIAANDLQLVCQHAPASQFGLYIVGTQSVTPVPVPNNQGLRCIGGDLGRYNNQVSNGGDFGRFSLFVDNTSMPGAASLYAATVGSTSFFQCWFRDFNPGLTSNFSDAFAVTWTP